MSPARPASIDLNALAGALAQLGAEQASTVALARAAGVAKPTLFARFGSREALVLACVEREAERLVDHVHEPRDPGAGLAAYAAESPGWPLLLLARHPAAVAARRRVAARMARGRRGGAGLSAEAAASALLAAAATLLEVAPDTAAAALPPLAALLLPAPTE